MYCVMPLRKVAAATCLALSAFCAYANDLSNDEIERVSIYADQLFQDTTEISPTSVLTNEDLKAVNVITAEDVVSYQPNLVVRRRYVGDPNGVIGVRGSGMFQTARALVFADGLPLHYLLQTRWNGSPRWSLVGPDEIQTAEVIYGPFSAEYSGNAMGGVVKLTTRNPDKQRFVAQGTLMAQDYNVLGTDDRFNGNRAYFSYEDVAGDLGWFVSYNRLDNQSHPMTHYSIDADNAQALTDQGVSGFISGVDDEGEAVIYIGDSGAETSVTELYKTKLVCTLNNAELRATIAYEQRSRDEDDKRNYLTDSDGALYWQTGNRNFEQRHQQRDSLLVGIGISGEIVNDWVYDMYATDFEIREDEEIRTGLNPSDPTFGSRDGRLTRYDNTGWNTFNVKIGTQSWLNDDSMRLSFGAAADQYTLGINPFNINAITGEILNDRAQSRGKTQTRSLFAQYGWAINPHWELSLGLRWEDWQTSKGFYNDTVAEDRSDSGVSPKLSLAWMPNQQWKVRYSAAKALRFPIAEELYRNEQATTSIVVSDPTLAPEEGVFHNLTFETLTSDGLMRFNLFHDTVEDAIYYQRGTINDGGTQVSVNTFLAIDQVQTQGVEWILNQNNLFDSNLSMKFNLAYTDATIEANQANPAIEGNKMPRIPEWRANMLLSYALSKDINLNLSARYSSKSFGQLDNSDTTRNVYGAIDNFLFVNLTANWQITEQVRLSAGIDNLFDELAYVAHPYPMRTLFLQARYVFDGE